MLTSIILLCVAAVGVAAFVRTRPLSVLLHRACVGLSALALMLPLQTAAAAPADELRWQTRQIPAAETMLAYKPGSDDTRNKDLFLQRLEQQANKHKELMRQRNEEAYLRTTRDELAKERGEEYANDWYRRMKELGAGVRERRTQERRTRYQQYQDNGDSLKEHLKMLCKRNRRVACPR